MTNLITTLSLVKRIVQSMLQVIMSDAAVSFLFHQKHIFLLKMVLMCLKWIQLLVTSHLVP